MLMEHMNGAPLQVKQIREWTRRDVLSECISGCCRFLARECTDRKCSRDMRRQNELSVEEGAFCGEQEFEHFLKNGIKHVTTAPYHPSSNGCAERAVRRVFKEGIKKMGRVVWRRSYPGSCLSTDQPLRPRPSHAAELLMNRRIRTQLDLVRPSLAGKVGLNQAKQKEHHDKHAGTAPSQADSVYVRGYAGKWIPATLIGGPPSILESETQDGKLVRRHQDQIRPRDDWTQTESNLQEESFPVDPTPPEPEKSRATGSSTRRWCLSPRTGLDRDNPYPERVRRAPHYLKDYVCEGAE
ncbi:hypothetical protein AAFF_G00248770 [Aldrovandia affinis]|uniref:Integrase catalytic domain-containing protein n=1 Tax=Aldrovandia affinis TaxID=143900 RepID=A0AAD7W427_9TELE|nr:hypothetical protein AAFF_G00248770 [Aldrovandia affinis]